MAIAKGKAKATRQLTPVGGNGKKARQGIYTHTGKRILARWKGTRLRQKTTLNLLMSRYYNQVMRRVQTDFTPEQIFQQSIPMDVNVAKAVDSFMPVVTSMPNTAGFIKLTQEFLQKVEAFG